MVNSNITPDFISTINSFNSSHSLISQSISELGSLVAKIDLAAKELESREKRLFQDEEDLKTRVKDFNVREKRLKSNEDKMKERMESLEQRKKLMEVNRAKMMNKIKLNVGMFHYFTMK
jgi:uncharacterized protein (DUF3084 family)